MDNDKLIEKYIGGEAGKKFTGEAETATKNKFTCSCGHSFEKHGPKGKCFECGKSCKCDEVNERKKFKSGRNRVMSVDQAHEEVGMLIGDLEEIADSIKDDYEVFKKKYRRSEGDEKKLNSLAKELQSYIFNLNS